MRGTKGRWRESENERIKGRAKNTRMQGGKTKGKDRKGKRYMRKGRSKSLRRKGIEAEADCSIIAQECRWWWWWWWW